MIDIILGGICGAGILFTILTVNDNLFLKYIELRKEIKDHWK